MSKEKSGTRSYFNAFKNAIFPFEGKYFYLSGELNKQKTQNEINKTTATNSGNLAEKPSCNDDKYKEILGDKTQDNETKTINKKWEINGLKDTKVYHEDQHMNTEDKNGYLRYQQEYNKDNMRSCNKDSMMSLKINFKSDTYCESQQREINRLRTQIEKLSAFVESSDERREQSEKLLAQKNEELVKEIREKEILANRVCCLEELRRNLQQKVDEITDENNSLKMNLKLTEEKLVEEKEKVIVLKEECSIEIEKNVELELVLQTIREELGCIAPACNSRDLEKTTRDNLEKEHREEIKIERNVHVKQGEKKVHWDDEKINNIKKSSFNPSLNAEQQTWDQNRKSHSTAETENGHRIKVPKHSCLKQHSTEATLWKREKKQFEGKILLLEMDKEKLRSQIDLLEQKIIKHENTGQSLRENNEVLEFRILELEYELLEKTRKSNIELVNQIIQ